MKVAIDPRTNLFVYHCPDVDPAADRHKVDVTQNYVGRLKHASEGWMIVLFTGVTAERVVEKAKQYWANALTAEAGRQAAAEAGRESSLAAQAARLASPAS